MKRKIVKQGGSALTITLPSKWTKKFNLDAGNEIEIQEKGKELVINPSDSSNSNSIEFDTLRKGFADYYLSYFYHKGFDEVKLIYNDHKIFDKTKKKLNELLGYEIIETGRNYCVIKNVSIAMESEFDSILRRIFLMLKAMAEECFEVVKSRQFDRLNEIKDMEKTNNKFTDFCLRILNKKGYKEYNKTISMYTIVRELEKVCDVYKYICDFFLNNDVKVSKETLDYFKKTNDFFILFYELFYKFDEKKVDDFFSKRKELVIEAHKLMKTKSKDEAILLHYLVNIVTQVFEMKGPYFEMNLGN